MVSDSVPALPPLNVCVFVCVRVFESRGFGRPRQLAGHRGTTLPKCLPKCCSHLCTELLKKIHFSHHLAALFHLLGIN